MTMENVEQIMVDVIPLIIANSFTVIFLIASVIMTQVLRQQMTTMMHILKTRAQVIKYP